MNNHIRRPLLSAAILALTIGIGLSACSKAPEQNAAEPSTSEQAATQPAASAPPAGAKKLDAKDLESLKETSDLPENFRTGE